ncbi:galactose-binding domain-like protein [Auriculariales sp. MPI-PUGE-AT-0066]|nr:galactose-binding domain-like protein [Auriculariales sp. MPI-PUGE-AT-0066]
MAETTGVASHLLGTDATNIYNLVDKANVHGLNLTVPEHARDVIKPWDQRDETTKFAESNVDDQLILHIPFIENVRVRAILLKLGRGEVTPRRLRIFINSPSSSDFGDLEDIKPHLDIALQDGETGIIEYPLRAPSFTNTNSVTLFFSDSSEGDQSRVFYVGFKGVTNAAKKEEANEIETPAANSADALLDAVREKRANKQDRIQ